MLIMTIYFCSNAQSFVNLINSDAQESISNITSTIIDILKNKYHIMDKNFFNNI